MLGHLGDGRARHRAVADQGAELPGGADLRVGWEQLERDSGGTLNAVTVMKVSLSTSSIIFFKGSFSPNRLDLHHLFNLNIQTAIPIGSHWG